MLSRVITFYIPIHIRLTRMKRIKRWHKNSMYIEPLSLGCKLCEKGSKLVLLVTGLCPASCFYCPLSEKKRGRDVIYADEWKLDDERDTDKILREAELIEAEGAGITGGDPLIVWKRTRDYISLLKENFGEDFHIHLYTSGIKESKHIPDLVSAGLDEIRFHPMPAYWKDMERSPIKKAIEISLKEDVDVAIEIPAIPGMKEEIKNLIRWGDEKGIRWINLNELEFSETNAEELMNRGFDVRNEVSSGVLGSEEEAISIIEEMAKENLSLGIHYCSSSFKDAIQLRNRIKRRAKNVAKPFEIISDEGLLIKGVIEVESKSFLEVLKRRYEIPEDLIHFDLEKNRIEIAPWILEEIADDLRREKIECYIVEEYPTADRLEVERFSLP